MKTIHVCIKHVYGVQNVYPLCDTGKALAELAGKKTFTPQAIRILKNLGYSFEINNPQVTI